MSIGVIEVLVGNFLCEISFPLKTPGAFFDHPLLPELPIHYTCLINKSFAWCWDKQKGGFFYHCQIPNLIFLKSQARPDNKSHQKERSVFLEVKTEKGKQLIHQKGGELSHGEMDDRLTSNSVFPERSVIG